MTPSVVWCPKFPADLRAIVEPIVEAHLKYLPAWVHEVPIYWCDDLNPAMAQARVNDEYRWLALDIGPAFYTATDREHVILHEFCHAYTIPISRVARDCIGNFFPGEPTPGTRIADDVITQRMEAATEDMAIMLERIR